MSVVIAYLVAAAALFADPGCARLEPPVAGPIVNPYAPIGLYGGHWGVDFAAEPGTPVAAAASGTVTFAGSVGGRLSVTIAHGGGLRTSYSYLSDIAVARGVRVGRGDVVGTSGPAHDESLTHFSVRIDDTYQDPAPWLICVRAPAPALHLAPVFGRTVYPRHGATRDSRWNLRSSAHRASSGRRGRPPRARTRRRDVHPRRVALAEGR